jgi:hypothetical protein
MLESTEVVVEVRQFQPSSAPGAAQDSERRPIVSFCIAEATVVLADDAQLIVNFSDQRMTAAESDPCRSQRADQSLTGRRQTAPHLVLVCEAELGLDLIGTGTAPGH